MFVAQCLEQQTDRRYRRDWRVVVYRVALDEKHRLIWLTHERRRWWGPLRRRDGIGLATVTTAEQRARQNMLKDVPEIPALRNRKPVTAREAAKLTQIRDRAALDFLMEQNLNDPAVRNVPKGTKAAPSPREANEKGLRHAEGKVSEYEAKIRRCETFLKKWRRRVKMYRKRLEGVEGADTTTNK